MKLAGYFLCLFLTGVATISAQDQKSTPAVPDVVQLQQMAVRFALTPLEVNTSKLSVGDRQALVKLLT